jgi:hypothetical protein
VAAWFIARGVTQADGEELTDLLAADAGLR